MHLDFLAQFSELNLPFGNVQIKIYINKNTFLFMILKVDEFQDFGNTDPHGFRI